MSDLNKADIRSLVLKCLYKNRSIQIGTIPEVVRAQMSDKVNRAHLKKLIEEIIQDLIVERFLTYGSEDGNAEPRYPFIRLTDLGIAMIADTDPHFFDPEEYLAHLETIAPGIDVVTKQYVIESLRCFRQNLLFASAVMIGAAAEKELLSLLEAISFWEPVPAKKKKIDDLLNRSARLPAIFTTIQESIDEATNKYGMPYAIYEGATQHLLSFQEMVRKQRNDAVHPTAGIVSRGAVFLALQTFPVAVNVLKRISKWFHH